LKDDAVKTSIEPLACVLPDQRSVERTKLGDDLLLEETRRTTGFRSWFLEGDYRRYSNKPGKWLDRFYSGLSCEEALFNQFGEQTQHECVMLAPTGGPPIRQIQAPKGATNA
jgi:hypothetical protein